MWEHRQGPWQHSKTEPFKKSWFLSICSESMRSNFVWCLVLIANFWNNIESEEMSLETKPFLSYHSDDDNSSTTSVPRKRQTCKQKICHAIRANILSYSIVFVATSFLWMLIVFTFTPDASSHYRTPTKPDAKIHNITSDMHLLTCGPNRSNEEARSRGCKYDVLLNGWVPEPCYDPEFVRFSMLVITMHRLTCSIDNRIHGWPLFHSIPWRKPHRATQNHWRDGWAGALLYLDERSRKSLCHDVEEAILGVVWGETEYR